MTKRLNRLICKGLYLQALLFFFCFCNPAKAQSKIWHIGNSSQLTLFTLNCDTLFQVGKYLIAFKYNGKYGFYALTQQTVQYPIYDDVIPLDTQMAIARIGKDFHHIRLKKPGNGFFTFNAKNHTEYKWLPPFVCMAKPSLFVSEDTCWEIFSGQNGTTETACGKLSMLGNLLKVTNNSATELFSNASGMVFRTYVFDVIQYANGLAIGKQNDRNFLLDPNGKAIGIRSFRKLTMLPSSVILAQDSTGFEVINSNAEVIFKADTLFFTGSGYCVFMHKKPLKWGIADAIFKEIQIKGFKKISGMLPTGIGKVILITEKGKFLYDPELRKTGFKLNKDLQKIKNLSEDRAAVCIGKRCGFADAEGIIRVSSRYDSVLDFSEQLSAVKFSNKWGFIDHNEMLVIQPHFDSVSSFKNGLAQVWKEGKTGLIDKTGKEVITCEWTNVKEEKSGYYQVDKKDRKGYFFKTGVAILPAKYDQLMLNDRIGIIERRDKKYGLIDLNGKEKLALGYRFIGYMPYNDFFYFCP